MFIFRLFLNFSNFWNILFSMIFLIDSSKFFSFVHFFWNVDFFFKNFKFLLNKKTKYKIPLKRVQMPGEWKNKNFYPKNSKLITFFSIQKKIELKFIFLNKISIFEENFDFWPNFDFWTKCRFLNIISIFDQI